MQAESLSREERMFSQMPIPKAVGAMVVPTIISQLITVVYNLADTWFVGLTGSNAAVAAVSLCLPLYSLLTAFSNLFGIGGASVIARAMGMHNLSRARRAFSLSVRGALAAACAYSLLMLLCARPLLMLIGGDDSNIGHALTYAHVTITLGGIPTVLSAVFAHLIRATGKSREASFGITMGAVLNLILDPLFMFLLLPPGNEVLGAAIATAISNVVSMVYFLLQLRRHTESGIFRFSLRPEDRAEKPLADILRSGAPSFCLIGMSMFSNCFLNGMLSDMGQSASVAGIGIVRKIDSVAFAVNQGISQGMLPIVAYCFSARLHSRMKKVIFYCAGCTMAFSLLWSTASYLFAPELVGFFIRDADTVYYGARFLRILCFSVAIYPALFVIISVFQAMGKSVTPFLLSLLHKGSLDIVLFFVIRHFWGLEHILWAAPIMDTLSLVLGLLLFLRHLRMLQREPAQA